MDRNNLSDIERTSPEDCMSSGRTEGHDQKKFSNAQPVWHLVLLLLTTGGVYHIYWFYRNWTQLNEFLKMGWRPWLRTILLFIPLAKWIVVFELFQDIRDFSKYAGVKKTYSPYWIFLAFFSFFGFYLVLPEPYGSIIVNSIRFLLPILPIWSLAVVQRTLNAYWEKKQPGLPERTNLSLPEICLMVIVTILIINSNLWQIGFIPEELVIPSHTPISMP